jgi:hypothetical protein
MGQDNRPALIRRGKFNTVLAHGWVRFDNGWLLTTCGLGAAPGDYELLPEKSPVTCITCLVKSR